MKKALTDISAAVAGFLLIIGILIASIEVFAVNPGFFASEYKKLDTAQRIGISEDDLSIVTKNLLDYTTGARDTLDMKAQISGQMQEVFGDREKEHMVDVRELYLGARDVRTFSLIGAAFFIILAFILGWREALWRLGRAFLRVSAAFVVIVAGLAIYAAADFTSFWTSFHHMFFTNDLWILNAQTDVLIMMVPEQFFSDLVMWIIICFLSAFAVLNTAALSVTWRHKRKLRLKPGEAD